MDWRSGHRPQRLTAIPNSMKAATFKLYRKVDSRKTRVDTTGSTSCTMGSKHSKDRKGGERI